MFLVASLLLVVRPGAPSSVLAPSGDASLVASCVARGTMPASDRSQLRSAARFPALCWVLSGYICDIAAPWAVAWPRAVGERETRVCNCGRVSARLGVDWWHLVLGNPTR